LGCHPKPKSRAYDSVERAADSAIKKVIGLQIYYGPGDIQEAGAGAKGKKTRPKGLK